LGPRVSRIVSILAREIPSDARFFVGYADLIAQPITPLADILLRQSIPGGSEPIL
jgi:hypothetical protein